MKVNGVAWRSIAEDGSQAVRIVDQTRLPFEFATLRLGSCDEIEQAIRTMQVRGAPLIGVAAAYGLALAMHEDAGEKSLAAAYARLMQSRPTAVNLRWALQRMRALLQPLPESARAAAAWKEAGSIAEQDVAINRALGGFGAELIARMHARTERPVRVLTHCNAGWIATVDYGTALSAIYQAHDAGVPVHVWVDETRPRNQGLLTAWELAAHGVPHTLIADNAGGHLMQRGEVDLVLVGADRVSRDGDVCNKIGTYLKALAAFDNDVPFYAAVPSPTIDWQLVDAKHQIEIEERSADEVRVVAGRDGQGRPASVTLADESTAIANPAFDITPARLVTAIITERGVAAPAQLQSLFAPTRVAA
jgi:methylthioribose-1-phosphate isomerase